MPGRTLTNLDAYALINAIAKEATGQQNAIQAVNTSTFVSVGETILRTGTENTLNAISLVLGRTFMAVRPYEAKLKIVNVLNSGLFSNRVRKISFYSREAEPSGAFNTDLYTNHAMDYDNGSNSGNSLPTMWEQNQPVPLEMNFAGSSVWDDSTTVYEEQLKAAFRDEASFIQFMSGVMTEKGSDVETQKEAFNRAALLNFIGGIYDMNTAAGGAFDLTSEYNTAFGTSYTGAQLRTTYIREFLEFLTAFLKTLSNRLTNRSKKYHWSPAKTINGVSYTLLRHTPKSKQKMIMLAPFWTLAEAKVLPEVFNDRYLKQENFEAVDFWQNELNPEGIDIVPAIPDTSDPTTQTAGARVQLDYVLGVVYDEDALMVDYQLDSSYSTPIEARKLYRNIWWHFKRNIINDFTENAVLLYMS